MLTDVGEGGDSFKESRYSEKFRNWIKKYFELLLNTFSAGRKTADNVSDGT